MNLDFSDLQIRQLFGSEDAETESSNRFHEYFVKNRAYENLRAELPLRILVGHKGVGKSALLRFSFDEDTKNQILSVFLKPDDLSDLLKVPNNADINTLIDAWKTGIRKAVAEKAVENLTDGAIDGIDQTVISFGARKITSILKDALSTYKPNILVAAQASIYENFLKNNRVNVYIDDIDRGWSARPQDIVNLSALLNALKDISSKDSAIQCRIALRSDVYFLVRTSDESTDKIEQDIVRLFWSNDEILRLMAYRIATYLRLDFSREAIARLTQSEITNQILSHIMEPKFQGRGKWENEKVHRVIMSLCRARPRDLVKLLHGAARNASARGGSKITTQDFTKCFEAYSNERLQDLFNEFRSELPNIDNFIMQFKPTKIQKTARENYHYTNDQIIRRISLARQAAPVMFVSKRIATDKAILTFLYKIDFLIARFKGIDGRPEWKYFEQGQFLAHEAVDFGNSWEIHPAYRWSLQPNDIQSVIDTIPLQQ
jgi:hypothetical protein